MKDDQVLIAVVIVVAAFAVTAIAMMAITCRHIEKMAELGYQEEILPGSSMSYWRRCK